MNFKYADRSFTFKRYPESSNRSLRPWSAADEYIINYLEENKIGSSKVAIVNDRFGFLSTLLYSYKPYSVISYSSQEKALRQNFLANKVDINIERWVAPLSPMPETIDTGLIRIPKSIDLFRLYLHHLSEYLSDEGTVICSFMTRHFTPQLLEVAGEYFEHVEQSKAWKKARLLILKGKKTLPEADLTNKIELDNKESIEQYYGVFSSNHIDYGTQFLLENLPLKEEDSTILDLASGNGIIARNIREQNLTAELHLMDDFSLAVESSKLNVSGEKTYFHQSDSLELFQHKFFDLVVSNPPFHFEYENNIDVSLNLFKEVKKCLKETGRFVLVANKHLNYKTHLDKLFSSVQIVEENEKYVIYSCTN